jgi:hypothetical protein
MAARLDGTYCDPVLLAIVTRLRMPSIPGTNDFSAENISHGKEVNNMNYSKPEISDLPNPVTAIQAGESLVLSKSQNGQDGTSDTRMTPAAYIADE